VPSTINQTRYSMEIKKIFTIVVTYNGKKWYDKCFQSLLSSTVKTRIIVVDNNSGDDTAQYIRTNYPSIIFLPQDKNLGFGKANNIGISYALSEGCDYVFLLNQDAWVAVDCISSLIEQSEANPSYGILSPLHFSKDREHFESGLLNYLSDNHITDSSFFEDVYFGRQKPIYETKFINAAGWLLPKTTLETLGGFDPIFYHYEEDVDYLNRARFHSLKIGIVTKAEIIHDHCRRPQTKEEVERRHYQYLLSQYVDLNASTSFSSYFRYYSRKIFLSLLQFDQSALHLWFGNLLFLIKTKKRVKISRLTNAQNGRLWIE